MIMAKKVPIKPPREIFKMMQNALPDNIEVKADCYLKRGGKKVECTIDIEEKPEGGE
jgi:hypothetical protein